MLELRPHHFFCTLAFAGKGYSVEFVKGFQRIADSLRVDPRGDETLIRVTSVTDSICTPCPSRLGTRCESEEKIQTLDRAHAKILNLNEGDLITWGEAKKRLAEKMTLENHEQACAPCGWKSLGLCKTALEKLKQVAPALALLLVLQAAYSPHVLAQDEPAPEAHRTIDVIRAELFKTHRSPKATKLAKASLALQASKYAQARELAKSLLNDETFSDDATEVTARSYLAEAESLNDRKSFAQALVLAKKAFDLFAQTGTRRPYSPFQKKQNDALAESEIAQANAQVGLAKFKAAMPLFENGFQRLTQPGSSLSGLGPVTLGNYAQSCFRSPSQLCSAWIRRFSTQYHKHSPEIQAMARSIPEVEERAFAPKQVGKQSTQAYKAPDLDITAFDSAMMLLTQTHYRDSAKAFQSFLDEYPKSAYRYRARYWLGQSYLRNGDKDQGNRTLTELLADSPLTYYGLLAAMALDRRIDSAIDATLPQAKSDDPFLLPLEVFRVRRAENLVAAGAKDLASADLKDVKARDALSSPFLLYLATLNYEAGNHSTSFGIVGELIQRNFPGILSSYGLKLVFPVENMEVIKKYSDESKVDPILILSLMKQESAFDMQAISSSGALGLMQLMPATATDTESSVKRAELIKADANIRVGTKYLKKLLDHFHGNIAQALAGYNAGPYAVARWMKGQENRGMLEFIEAIPYKETREYVGSIIRNYCWYSLRINGELPKNLDYFWGVGTSPVAVTSPSPSPEASPSPSVSPSPEISPSPSPTVTE